MMTITILDMRLWLGSQFELAYMKCREDYSGGDVEIDLFGIGLAPVFAVNFNFGSIISICSEVGYRFFYLKGNSTKRRDIDIDSFKIDWKVNINEYFLRVDFIHRINDLY